MHRCKPLSFFPEMGRINFLSDESAAVLCAGCLIAGSSWFQWLHTGVRSHETLEIPVGLCFVL